MGHLGLGHTTVTDGVVKRGHQTVEFPAKGSAANRVAVDLALLAPATVGQHDIGRQASRGQVAQLGGQPASAVFLPLLVHHDLLDVLGEVGVQRRPYRDVAGHGCVPFDDPAGEDLLGFGAHGVLGG